MANNPIIMTQIRRILQLFASGASQREVTRKTSVHRRVVATYHQKFIIHGLSFDDLLKLDDQGLSSIAYSSTAATVIDSRLVNLEKLIPNYLLDLKKVGVTRKLLWQEYLALHPDGYGYTQFCDHFARISNLKKATMHFTHRPSEVLQVDFAGKKLRFIDPSTGEVIYCDVLVCTLPFSKYTYVEAMASACQENMYGALNRCLEFLGGVPMTVLSDNMKQFVQKNNRYEFTFQSLADQWSVHYNTNLDATRPRKPKDKPTVEGHVNNIYNSIYGRLRDKEFHSLEALNEAIRPLLSDFNKGQFQKLPGSREEIFITQEQPLLKPLPSEHFTVRHTTSAKVQFNYHVELGENKHYYSVPYQYIGKQTKVIYDQSTVEIFVGIERIAVHKRNFKKNGYTTLEAHMPAAHKFHAESQGWDDLYFNAFATKIGPNAQAVFAHVLSSRHFKEQSYKACLGLKSLSTNYSEARFENACRRALKGFYINYGTIKSILEKNLDGQIDPPLEMDSIIEHDNLRPSGTYI